MGDETENVMQYCFSDSLCKVVVLSDKNHLYSYMLEENDKDDFSIKPSTKFNEACGDLINMEEVNKLKGTVLKENICSIQWYFKGKVVN